MPAILSLVLIAVAGILIAAVFLMALRLALSRQMHQRLGLHEDMAKAWRMYWLVFVPILVFALLLKPYAERRVYAWLARAVVATLPDGTVAIGKWWIDDKGIGHTQLATATQSCTDTYDAKSHATFLYTQAACKDAHGAEVLVERFGGKIKDSGEGVWKRGDQYGWYVFGWKARLAILTDGWLGLPGHKASARDFNRLEAREKLSKHA